MSRPLRFIRSLQGELCVVGSAYATTPDLPLRRIPLPGGKVGIPAADLFDYHANALNDEAATHAAKALHRARCVMLRSALAAEKG